MELEAERLSESSRSRSPSSSLTPRVLSESHTASRSREALQTRTASPAAVSSHVDRVAGIATSQEIAHAWRPSSHWSESVSLPHSLPLGRRERGF